MSVITTPAGNFAAQAAKAATTTVPIVFGVAEDPVKLNASIIAEIDIAFAPLASDRPEDLPSPVHGMPAVQLSAVETPL